jgi:hypothetical protein
MEPLSNLVRRVTTDYANDALCASFVFPRTDALRESFSKAIVKVEQQTLDLNALELLVTNDPGLTAIGGRKDVLAVLSAVKPLTGELNLERMDGLIFYRGGLDILALRLTNNDCGRCAYVEINDYRRKLVALATSAKSVLATPLQAVGLLVIFAGLLALAQVAADRFVGKRGDTK